MKKILSVLVALFIFSTAASAHVVVKPAEVGVGAFQTFSTGVPNEKDSPTVGIKVLIPEGLKHVSPNVKPGWTMAVKKSGEGESATVTEIDWTGGSIPSGQRDDFVFGAQAPAQETTLKWKAIQTYQNGDVVEWTHDSSSKGGDDDSAPPPYSQTKVINDLAGTVSTQSESKEDEKHDVWTSYIALAVATASLAISLRKK